MSRCTAPVPLCLIVAVLWLAAFAAGLGAPVQQVTVDISGLTFQDQLNQSASNTTAQIQLARAYSYSVNATVHGNGPLFSIFFGTGTSLGVVLDLLQAGSASQLSGTVPDLSGTLPLDLLNDNASNSISLLGATIAVTADMDLAIDATGTVSLSLTNVSVLLNGADDTADTIVIEPGSTITVTAILPPVATASATNITPSSVVISGSINPEAANSTATLQWGLDSTYGHSVSLQSVPAGLNAVPVSAAITNLTPGTVYHYAIFASNISGTGQSVDATFETAPPPPPGSPFVTTGAASGVTFGSATLNAIVNPNGFDTTVVFQYGSDFNYGFTSPPVDAGAGTVGITVTATIQNLQPGQTYHYRPIASNTNAAIDGLDDTFQTTGGAAPSIVTGSVGGVSISSAILYALVNPDGADTFVSFDYGLTSSYGSSLPVPGDISSGAGQANVSGTLTGLQPGAIYHYRINAGNSAGAVSSADQLFATTSVLFGSYQGEYAGLFLGSPVSLADSGFFTVFVDAIGGFTASGSIGRRNISFAGTFDQNGSAVVSVRKTGFTAHLQLGGSGPARTITGTLSGPATVLLSASVVQFPATPALYTIRMPHPAGPGLPQGNGYGSLKITNTGFVTFSGKLGDGTPITCGSFLVSGSAIPLYAPLYRKSGAIIGNLLFETSSNGVVDAVLTWFRPGTAPIPLVLYGSAYKPPAPGQPVISASSGDFLFISGAESFSQSVSLSAPNRATPVLPNPHRFRATIAPATGLFTGSIIDPATGKPAPFSGAFFQDTNLATGLFQTKPNPGEVDFQPSP